MPRLPIPGSDSGTWGTILNDYLSAAHNADGSLASGAVSSAVLGASSVSAGKLNAGSGTDGQVLTLDSGAAGGFSWTTVSGGGGGDPTMGGDLTGTASNAQLAAGVVGTTELADGSVTNVKVASGIAQAKITNLTSDLAAKANDADVVKLTGAQTVAGVKTFSASPIVPTPTTTGQAATKGYVDGAVAGMPDTSFTAVSVIGSHTASDLECVLADASGGGFTVTLPTPVDGAMVRVKKADDTDGNGIFVQLTGVPVGQEQTVLIDTAWTSLDFFSSSSQWYRI